MITDTLCCGYYLYDNAPLCPFCKAPNPHYKATPSASSPPKEAPTMCLGCLHNQALPNTKFCEQCGGPPSKRYKGEFMPHAQALFDEAMGLINGPRKADYGHYADEARDIAKMWTALLSDVLKEDAMIEDRRVPIMMMALKLNRMKRKGHHDSLADTVGYAGLLAELEGMV